MTIKLTLAHVRLALFLVWMIVVLPTLTWLTLTQFFPVEYLQIFLPYVLLYGLVVSEELLRGFIQKGA